MKTLYIFSRFFVGGLFVFSGLIKANDPVATSIKLKEYLEVFSFDISSVFHVFIPYTLYFSIFIIMLEVMLGTAACLGYKPKIIYSILLGLIVFFTFLTFYSAYFNKVTDCGCFGDFIKLSPWQSFTKDIILLVFIIVLFSKRNSIALSPIFRKHLIFASSGVVTFLLAIYAIEHLPYFDFRDYKVGNNIATLMESSEDPKFLYLFKKDGKEMWSGKYLSSDDGYEYLKYKVVNEKESTPKIQDFGIWSHNSDITKEVLNGNKLLILFHSIEKANPQNIDRVRDLINSLEGRVETLAISSSDKIISESFRHEYQLPITFYSADATLLKTMIRSNPGTMLLKNGLIKGKWHYNDTPPARKVLSLLQE